MKGCFISDITHADAANLINEDTIIVLPIGCGAKEHGNHSPMATDYYLADWMARHITENFKVVTLPTLPYAHFPPFYKFKGTVSLSAGNFTNVVRDIILNFQKHGVWKFLIMDIGVTTHFPLRAMARDLNNDYNIKVAVSNVRGLMAETEHLLGQESGGHGDEGETSCMLYINANLVHMDKAVEEYDAPHLPGTVVDGVTKIYFPSRIATNSGTNGNSKLATYEKGEKIMNSMLTDILAFLEFFEGYKKSDIES